MVKEDLCAMEGLLAAVSCEDLKLESPCWHENALKITVARHMAGLEQPLDWVEAKRQLRKRTE